MYKIPFQSLIYYFLNQIIKKTDLKFVDKIRKLTWRDVLIQFAKFSVLRAIVRGVGANPGRDGPGYSQINCNQIGKL